MGQLVERGAEAEGPSFKDFLASMPNVGEDADFAPERDLPREVLPTGGGHSMCQTRSPRSTGCWARRPLFTA